MAACKTILIVEDDKDISENLTYALESEGYHVHTCGDGKEAITYLQSLAREEVPGCIILDLMMPVMDGESFLKILHSELVEYSKIPVLISTAMTNENFVQGLNGAIERLRKPIELNRLLKAVQRHCGNPSS